jgi:hypothetical protein
VGARGEKLYILAGYQAGRRNLEQLLLLDAIIYICRNSSIEASKSTSQTTSDKDAAMAVNGHLVLVLLGARTRIKPQGLCQRQKDDPSVFTFQSVRWLSREKNYQLRVYQGYHKQKTKEWLP